MFFFSGPHLQHMEVPRLGVKLEPQLLAYPTATIRPDPSRSYDLHWILTPLSESGLEPVSSRILVGL